MLRFKCAVRPAGLKHGHSPAEDRALRWVWGLPWGVSDGHKLREAPGSTHGLLLGRRPIGRHVARPSERIRDIYERSEFRHSPCPENAAPRNGNIDHSAEQEKNREPWEPSFHAIILHCCLLSLSFEIASVLVARPSWPCDRLIDRPHGRDAHATLEVEVISLSKQFDVIVLGVGAMGASAYYHLASRGAAVLGLDQFDIPNDQGSAHGQSRAFRMCYYEHPDYVPLLRRSLELWHQLEEITQRKLLHMTGGIWFGPADCELIAGSRDAAVTHDLAHEWIEHDELAKRYPQFTVPDDYVGFYEPQAGLLLPEKIISAYAEDATKRGAVLRPNEPVVKWEAGSKSVTIHTTQSKYEADHLVVCAGPWSSRILGEIGVELPVTRQIAIWVQPPEAELFTLGTLPIWAIDRPKGGMYYGFPILDDTPGFKLAVHYPGEPADPDSIDRVAQPDESNELREMLGRFIPGADGPLLEASVCMYTNTPDAHFIVDHHPQHANVTIAAGFSGHGFKFASAIGEALADLALDGRTGLPIGFLGLERG